eukprot:10999537-Alexandrium_andersonii.AAC.1
MRRAQSNGASWSSLRVVTSLALAQLCACKQRARSAPSRKNRLVELVCASGVSVSPVPCADSPIN